MPDCACVYSDPDHYTNEISSKNVLSRKPHSCSECGGVIPARSRYERYVGIDDGDFFVHKTCSDCLSIRDEMFCGSWIWGQLLEAVCEHVCDMSGEISADCLLALTPTARLRIIGYIDELWADWNEGDDDD